MYVSLHSILKHPVFKDAKLLAGKDGVMKHVKRVSVFDCPVSEDMVNAKFIEPDDFFISRLRQFQRTEDFFHFVQLLVQLESSGLCIVADKIAHLLTEEILTYCNTHRFALIQVAENLPYAYIMDTINSFISMDNLNAMHQFKLDQIMTTKFSDREKLQLLHSINGTVERFVQVIHLTGQMRSELGDDALSVEFLHRSQDIFVNHKQMKIFIISSSTPEKLAIRSSVAQQQMAEHFTDYCLGISRIHEGYDIDRALEEANSALQEAKATKVTVLEYKPLSATQLLIALKGSRSVIEFYETYTRKIRENVSADNLAEMLRTAELYVTHRGDYKGVAKIINQHENTVRYRMNKIRGFLALENDPVTFHETISLAVKIGLLLHR